MLGCSEKSIEREAARGKLEQGWRRIPGRRPIAVFRPEDVEKLRGQTVRAVPAPEEEPPTKSLALVPRGAADILRAIQAATPRLPIDRKLFLNLQEASEFTGLSMALLRRKIVSGELPAIKDGGWKVRRDALERL